MKNLVYKNLFIVRKALYSMLCLINPFFSYSDKQLLVLCYHSINSDNWRFGVNVEEFKRQIDFVLQNYQPLTVTDFIDVITSQKVQTQKSFLVTFDDGYKDILSIKNFLKQKNVKPTLFILGDRLKANRKELNTDRDFLNKNEILDLYKSGWTIGSHSLTHADFDKLSEAELLQEIKASKDKIEKDLHIKINYLAYPKGNYTQKAIRIAKSAGYKAAFSMDDGFIDQHTDLYTIPRVGIDRSHNFTEFKNTILPSVIIFRKLLKKLKITHLLGGFFE